MDTPSGVTAIADLRGQPLGALTPDSAALLNRLRHTERTAVPVAAFQSGI